MQRFARLYAALDATTRTTGKVAAMRTYFQEAPPEDAAWAVYFLSGRRPKRLLRASDFRQWGFEASGLPQWLFEESYASVGDLAETLSLLLPAPSWRADWSLSQVMADWVLPLGSMSPEEQHRSLLAVWDGLGGTDRFVFNKLITGGFRVGVSTRLMVRGLSAASGIEADVLMNRLMGHWEPSAEFFRGLSNPNTEDAASSRPYPFCLAHPLQIEIEELGKPSEWVCEWKWDGIRAQVVVRDGQVHIWTRGGELATEAFPEVADAARWLPDGTVLDGELLAWGPAGVLPFDQMQRRIGRKKVGAKLRKEVPVCLMAFDLLERSREDIRGHPLRHRRDLLEELILAAGSPVLRTSEIVAGADWPEIAKARSESSGRGVEGLMLKRLDSPYAVGRPTGLWWKWKTEPLTVDAVLLYAQPGHGRRSGLYTDYTFAIWQGDQLVPFAKAYSGLENQEIREVDRFVRANTLERFGPVRSVKPELVFEIAFEGIWKSKRHKSGLAVRFPRISRWRRDKSAAEADQLDRLISMLEPEASD